VFDVKLHFSPVALLMDNANKAIIRAVMIVGRMKGKTLRTVQCCTVYHTCAQL